MLLIHPDSHLDHGLSVEHLSFLLKRFTDKNEFFIVTVTIPSELPQLSCSLYGPLMGDEPVNENEVFYRKRSGRAGLSRLIQKPKRESSLLTVIGGPHGQHSCILYTAYGGPGGAPREPWELESGSQKRKESDAFWALHALSFEGEL